MLKEYKSLFFNGEKCVLKNGDYVERWSKFFPGWHVNHYIAKFILLNKYLPEIVWRIEPLLSIVDTVKTVFHPVHSSVHGKKKKYCFFFFHGKKKLKQSNRKWLGMNQVDIFIPTVLFTPSTAVITNYTWCSFSTPIFLRTEIFICLMDYIPNIL